MKKLLLSLFLLLIINVNAQTKKSSSPPSKSEIDNLYIKYKGQEGITLYTSYGELYGKIYTESNSNEKAVSVTIHGNSENNPAIAEFISTTIKMKLKQGYKATRVPLGWNSLNSVEYVEHCLGWIFKGANSFQLLMKKGNMYFRVDAGCCVDKIDDGSIFGKYVYTWEIETCDLKRKGGDKATNFEF